MPPSSRRDRIDREQAIELVDRSVLFDPEWYADQTGRGFGDRRKAAEHWVDEGATSPAEPSPHPLFEPAWLYPQGRWRRSAPDPLSCYLARPDARTRSPHPAYDQRRLGRLEDWLADHDPAELLPAPAPRAPLTPVVVVVHGDDRTQLPELVAWVRHLHRVSPDVTGVVPVGSPAARRVLTAVAARMPSVRMGDLPTDQDVVTRVDVDAGVQPPSWSWLPELIAGLEQYPDAAAAQPLLLRPDFTVAAAGAAYFPGQPLRPLLAAHPVADAERLAGQALPASWPGVLARRPGKADGAVVLAPGSRLPADPLPPPTGLPEPTEERVRRTAELLRRSGFEAPDRPLTVREGRPALRWSIDIAAWARPLGRRWGDFHFATSLAAALERLGQWVALDHPETRGRATRALDDVQLTIRGLQRVSPTPGHVRLLWVISHPEDVTPSEVADYDVAYAASVTWAAGRSRDWGLAIAPLLQCTDPGRFRPGLAAPGSGPRYLVVANTRGQLRPAVREALAAGLPLTVYGTGWDRWVPAGAPVTVAASYVPNDRLGALYAGAGLVLGDHWDDMRATGFVSNRVFDVLATGARLLSDPVAGLDEALDDLAGAVPVWRDREDFRRLTAEPFEPHYPDDEARADVARRVVADHSFDARARVLLDAALAVRARTRS